MIFYLLSVLFESLLIVASESSYSGKPISSKESISSHARRALTTASSASMTFAAGYLGSKSVSAADAPGFESVESTASFIRSHCKSILTAVRDSGNLLYRGEKLVKRKPIILQSFSDLQDPKTYNSFAAADYFTFFLDNFTVEQFGGAHIGTSSAMEASVWGPVASIWPLDDPVNGGFNYCWLRRQKYFWDDDWGAPQSPRLSKLGGPFWWRDHENLNNFLSDNDNLALNTDLSTALSAGHEILFSNAGNLANQFAPANQPRSATGAAMKESQKTKKKNLKDSSVYVAVPLLFESRLLTALDIRPYSSSITTLKVHPDPDSYIDNKSPLRSQFPESL